MKTIIIIWLCLMSFAFGFMVADYLVTTHCIEQMDIMSDALNKQP